MTQPALTTDAQWISTPRPKPRAALRLICFPYAGRGASVYARWGKELEDAIEVSAVQLPGREARFRELPATRLDALVGDLVPSLTPLLDRPFAFYGHSLGSLIAFETARALRDRKYPQPAWLFVGAKRAPQLATNRRPIHRLHEVEFIAELRARFGGLPDVVLQERELLEAVLPALRADVGLLETYAYQPARPFDFPLSVFGGTRDQTVDRDGLEAWREQTSRTFQLRMIDGTHFFVNEQRGELLRMISHDLELCLSGLP